MEKTIKFLERLYSDMIDGIDSGINTEEEKNEVWQCLEELKKEKEDMIIQRDQLVKFHKDVEAKYLAKIHMLSDLAGRELEK